MLNKPQHQAPQNQSLHHQILSLAMQYFDFLNEEHNINELIHLGLGNIHLLNHFLILLQKFKYFRYCFHLNLNFH